MKPNKTLLFYTLLLAILTFAQSLFAVDKFKVAFTGVLEGNTSRVSSELLKGLQFYSWEIKNSANLIQLEIISFNEANKIDSLSQVKKKLQAENIHYLIGLPSSTDALIFAELIKNTDIALLTPFATSDQLAKYTNIFTFASVSVEQSQAIFKLISGSKKQEKLLIYDRMNSKAGTEVGQNLLQLCKVSKIICTSLNTQPALTINDLTNKILTDGITAIYFADGGDQTLALIKQLVSDKQLSQLRFFGSDNFGSKPMIESVLSSKYGDLNQRFYYVSHWDSALKTAKDFVSRYKKWRPGEEPTSGVHKAYITFDLLHKFAKDNSKNRSLEQFRTWIKNQKYKAQPIMMVIENGRLIPQEVVLK